jgi:hypothetical protein
MKTTLPFLSLLAFISTSAFATSFGDRACGKLYVGCINGSRECVVKGVITEDFNGRVVTIESANETVDHYLRQNIGKTIGAICAWGRVSEDGASIEANSITPNPAHPGVIGFGGQ